MKKTFLKKFILTSTIISTALFSVQIFFLLVEPAIATGASATDNVVVTLNVTSGISISNGPDTTMTPSLGVTSNKSVGSSAWSVATNNAIGYTLAVKASTAPALVSGANSFTDYTETIPGTPEVWSTIAGAKEFGYSVYGSNTPTATWGTSLDCGNTGTGVTAAAQKYRSFTTSDVTVATLGTVTPNTGITTNICFAAEQNAVYAPSGTYSATITATATTL